MADITHPNFDAFAASGPVGWDIDRNARVATYTQTATSDDFVQFTGNFNDDAPCTWVIPRIHQETGAITIRMHNANVIFYNGSIGFPGGTSAAALNAGVFSNAVGTACTWDLQNNNFIATNGAAASGFGQSSAGDQGSLGTIANNLFSAQLGDGRPGVTTLQQSLWFINLQGIPQINFANNEFVAGVANSASTGASLFGLSFDGQTRAGQGNYTTRVNPFSVGTWMSIEETTYQGTNYATSSTDPNTNNHIQAAEITNDRTIFSVNNRFEANAIAFHKLLGVGGTNTLREVYAWNPTFTQTGTTTAIADVVADFSSNTVAPTVFAAPANVYDRTTLPAGFINNAVVPSGADGAGFWIQTGSAAITTPDSLSIVTKALDFSTGSVIAPIEARFKSFTHNVSRLANSTANTRETGLNGVTYETQDQTFGTVDTVAGTLAAAPSATADIDTLDQLYQTLKRDWYSSTNNYDFPLTYTGSVLNGGNLTLGAASNEISSSDAQAQSIHLGSTPLGVGTNLTGLNFTTIDFGGNDLVNNGTFMGGTLSNIRVSGQSGINYNVNGDVVINLALTAGTYDSADLIGNPTIAPGASLTVTNATDTIQITNATAGVTYGTNVDVPVAINFTGIGGTADNGARVQLYGTNAAGVVPDDAADLLAGTGAGVDTASITDTTTGITIGAHYAWVYTRPGFQHEIQRFQLTIAGMDIALSPVETIGANPAAEGITEANVTAEFDADNDRLNINIIGANTGTGFGGGQTNRMFELAKEDISYGEAVAKIPLTNGEQIISHTSTIQTGLLRGTYFLNTGTALTQQTVSSLFERHGDGSFTPAFPLDTRGDVVATDNSVSVKAVLINPSATGISFADFEGGLEDFREDVWQEGVDRGYVEGGGLTPEDPSAATGGVVIGTTFAR